VVVLRSRVDMYKCVQWLNGDKQKT
jgi:hypothetical protein